MTKNSSSKQENTIRNVLYRKYRSQTFDELVGQAHITDILKNAVKSGNLSHAYLFVGSRGTGKTSTARILAKAINCENLSAEGNPCNECNKCVSITNGTYFDIIEIDAASNRGIDQIRELKERIEFAPSEGKYKIYIIDEVHMLTTEAFNGLLKTLEEPPEHVIFILATTDVHKLPATILSRCQRYDFRLGTDDQIREVIQLAAQNEGVKLSAEASDLLVENAHGSYRDSLSLLDVVVSGQIDSENPSEVSAGEVRTMLGIPDATMVFHLLDNLAERNAVGSLDLIEELNSRGINFQQFVKYLQSELRVLLIKQMKGEKDDGLLSKLSSRDILKFINLFIEAERKLRYTATPNLVLELVVAEICLEGESVAVIGNVDGRTPSGSGVSLGGKRGASSEGAGATETAGKNAPVNADKLTSEKVEKNESIEIIEDAVENIVKHEESVIEADDGADSEVADIVDIEVEVTNGDVSLTIKDVEDKWDNVLNTIQGLNGHLYGFMKTAKVCDLKEGFLCLEVPFEFHKERIESPTTREVIRQVLCDVYGSNIPMKCEVNSSIKNKKKVTADVILKNIPKPAEAKTSEEKPAAPSSDAGTQKQVEVNKPRAIDKKIEAIFAGM